MQIARMLDSLGRYSACLGLPQTMRYQMERILKRPEVRLQVRGMAHPIFLRPNQSDPLVFRQIFLDHDSDIELDPAPQCIIDGGANIGLASVLLANRYPNARIIAVEPDPENYRLACRNCAPYPHVRVICGGIWTKTALLKIENPTAESWAFTVREAEASDIDTFQGYTIRDLMAHAEMHTVDLLKLDVEGTEADLFSDPDTAWIAQVRVLVIEIHGERAAHAVESAMQPYHFARRQSGEKRVYTKQS